MSKLHSTEGSISQPSIDAMPSSMDKDANGVYSRDTSENDYDASIQNELDQIESNLEQLSENQKKRRMSKHEMDFLESELNMELETMDVSDFDMHLQKLISDNNSSLGKDKAGNIAEKHENTSSGVIDDLNHKEGETHENNFSPHNNSGPIVAVDSHSSGLSSAPENNNETQGRGGDVNSEKYVDPDAEFQEPEENQDFDERSTACKYAEKNKAEHVLPQEADAALIENGDQDSLGNNNEDKDKEKTEQENFNSPVTSESQFQPLSKVLSDADEKTAKRKHESVSDVASKKDKVLEEDVSNRSKKRKKSSIETIQVDSYKGVSIPANSELFKEPDNNSALQAYRNLLHNSEKTAGELSSHVNAQLSALPLQITAPDNLSFNVQTLIHTLPCLDNFATQILIKIAKGPYQKIMEIVSNRESYTSIMFGNLVELFETTKRIYNSEESPFFTVENVTFGLWKFGHPAPLFLRGKEDTIEGTLRKVNLATFLLATLGLIDLGFFFLNEAFLDVFCPPQNLDPSESLSLIKDESGYDKVTKLDVRNNRYQRSNQTKFLKAQAILYLELKTQAYISAIELGDRSKEDIIHDLFPENMDEILLRRKDPFYEPNGSKIERNATVFTPAELDFLKRCDYRKQTLLNTADDNVLMEKYEWIKFLNDLLEYVSKNIGFLIWGPKGKLSSELDKLNAKKDEKVVKTEIEEFKAKLQKDESNVTSDTVKSLPVSPQQDDPIDANGSDMSDISKKGTKAKKSTKNRPSTFRRVWTKEEEEALKEGLKQKGTHWTAILELYGPGGQINESLKNRSSLQLKDKARNWKIYYIKNNLPVPDYLNKATGYAEKFRKMKPLNDVSVNRPKATVGQYSSSTSSALAGGASQGTTNLASTDFPNSNVTTNGNSTNASHDNFENEVYNKMIETLLPENKTQDKAGDDDASELKELVAEAFK